MWLCLWLLSCLVVFSLIQICDDFKKYLSCHYFLFNSIIVGDYFFLIKKFCESYFLTQNMVCLDECEMWIWKGCIFCCSWLGCSIKANYVMADGVIQIFCILADILFNIFLSYQKTSIESSSYDCGFIYLIFQFYQFLLHTFRCSVIRYFHD